VSGEVEPVDYNSLSLLPQPATGTLGLNTGRIMEYMREKYLIILLLGSR